jgi:hypothetical protein
MSNKSPIMTTVQRYSSLVRWLVYSAPLSKGIIRDSMESRPHFPRPSNLFDRLGKVYPDLSVIFLA